MVKSVGENRLTYEEQPLNSRKNTDFYKTNHPGFPRGLPPHDPNNTFFAYMAMAAFDSWISVGWLLPREGLEPTLPRGKRILSPPRLPFRHLGLVVNGWKRRRADSNRRMGVLQTPALTSWLHRHTYKFAGAEDGIRTRDLLLGKEAFYR
jgi:hypothetical protein